MATSCKAKMAHNAEFLIGEKSEIIYKSGRINREAILLSGVYCDYIALYV